METKLTAALVRSLVETDPPVRDRCYFDVALPRFALRVKPATQPGLPWAAWYFIRYSVDGREKRIKVGNPRTMSLDDARQAAKRTLAAVDTGGDPAADRERQRLAWTVGQAIDAYIASEQFAKHTESVRYNAERAFDVHIRRHLGTVKLAAIDIPAVRRFMRAIENDTRQNSRKRRIGGAGAARKQVRFLSTLLTWCVGEGRLVTNPIIGNLRLSGDGERSAVITEPEQYLAFLRAMDELVLEGKLRPAIRVFFLVKAFTAMRRSEVQNLRLGQIDIENRRITLTDTKGIKLASRGPKQEIISLPEFAAAALAEILPKHGNPEDLVFPPKRGRKISVNRDWRLIQVRAGLPGDMVLHGLRHSAGTVAALEGMSLPEIQAMLRHRNPTTTSRYIHLANRLRSRLQDRAMASVTSGASCCRGRALRQGEQVAPIREGVCDSTSPRGAEAIRGRLAPLTAWRASNVCRAF
jgi:integrase